MGLVTLTAIRVGVCVRSSAIRKLSPHGWLVEIDLSLALRFGGGQRQLERGRVVIL